MEASGNSGSSVWIKSGDQTTGGPSRMALQDHWYPESHPALTGGGLAVGDRICVSGRGGSVGDPNKHSFFAAGASAVAWSIGPADIFFRCRSSLTHVEIIDPHRPLAAVTFLAGGGFHGV